MYFLCIRFFRPSTFHLPTDSFQPTPTALLPHSRYEYRFCPFDNVTQHDIQASWNAYNGVLGIWHSWEVADGRLDQQSFKEGDSCGSYNR